MSLISKLMKYGLIHKAINEAQKPQNQQKAKDLFRSMNEKRKNRGQQPPPR